MATEPVRTILLVEDDPSDAALLRRGFEKARVLNPIIHLTTGDHALEYLSGAGKYSDRVEFPLPALILLDLKLPGFSGLQLLQWKRAQPEIRRIPVVVLTGDSDATTVNSAYDLGVNSYLVKSGKSTDITYLVETIQRYWIGLNEAPQLVMRAEPE